MRQCAPHSEGAALAGVTPSALPPLKAGSEHVRNTATPPMAQVSSEGWVKLLRKVRTHWTWTAAGVVTPFQAWCDLLLDTAHDTFEHERLQRPLEPGEFSHSLAYLAERWSWDESKVRRFLARLVKSGEIRKTAPGDRRSGKPAIYYVVNYVRVHSDPTQGSDTPRDTPRDRGGDTGPGHTWHRNAGDGDRGGDRGGDTPRDTADRHQNKNSLPQEFQNKNTRAADAPPTVPDLSTKAGRDRYYPKAGANGRAPKSYPAWFDAFWQVFPAKNRNDKPRSYAEWRRIVVGGVNPQSLSMAAEGYATTCGEYPFAPVRWLRSEAWRADEASAAPTVPTGSELRRTQAPELESILADMGHPVTLRGSADWDGLPADVRAGCWGEFQRRRGQ